MYGIAMRLAAVAVCPAALASAQTGSGTIVGTVLDKSSGSIAGATTRLVSEDTGAVRAATTDLKAIFPSPR